MINRIEIVGWVGSVLFAFCGLPQAIHSWKQKNSDGITYSFLLMWTAGEIMTLVYVFQKSDVAPLLLNYAANIIFLSVIIWFKVFPKSRK
jgi:uncharacterized protein with PQ loop repeat